MPPSPSPHLPGINFDEGVLRVAGNETLYIQLLKQFVEKHGQDIKLLEHALGQGDERKARELLHTLKGVSGSISLDQLHQSVCNYDDGIDEEALQQMREQMAIVISSIKQL